MDLEQTHHHIGHLIDSGKPFLLGRPGGTESDGIYFFLKHRVHSLKKYPPHYSKSYSNRARALSGITHRDSTDLDEFHLAYLNAILTSNVVGFGLFAPGVLRLVDMMEKAGARITPIRQLEPFVAHSESVSPWTTALSGKKVLVIHPFTETIQSQYSRRTCISGVSDILPEFTLQVVKPPVTFAGEKSDKPWREHFDQLIRDIEGLDFDIALTSAGSYGLPIAHEIVKSGKQAIHLGGSLQLLFGIKGKRWESRTPFSAYMDETWVRPSANEVPAGSTRVEGGAYW